MVNSQKEKLIGVALPFTSPVTAAVVNESNV